LPPRGVYGTAMSSSENPGDPRELYLALLKGCLTRSLFIDEYHNEPRLRGWRRAVRDAANRVEKNLDWRIVERVTADAQARHEGRDFPQTAETMAGHLRLDNVRDCIASVLDDGVPGDLIETGVWRGGTAIYMRAVLAAYGAEDRAIWVADSFEGLPAPTADAHPADREYDLDGFSGLAVSLDQVKANFAKYDLLDDNVRFLAGWFKDTLATAPIEKLAVVRLDGDLYESTIDAITALYPKLSIGGYLIVDDYNAPLFADACGQAIRDYRAQHDITEPLQTIDWTGVYWRRAR
jgi:O-methyltransferase